jgi:hypothetical protein
MRSQEFVTLGSALVVLGIIFGASDRLIGYSFIGAGVLVSVIGGFKLRRKMRTQSHRSGGV